ncbi:MAG: tRNA (guanosine(46)-N7)-methyltransferase TrmB [Pseudorhodoplanes sp.]|uniref:tRNA (guanosine(46)-N7)-methyltransferase TrmB n=1 Tax=Pseudorhodoplanes sp. TaxID=1934341 RepID=UPI003D10F00F
MDAAVMHSDPRNETARGAFFGRRKGKALRSGQAKLIDALLPRLAIDLSQPAPASLSALFPGTVRETRLEIGFGGAEHLIAQAQASPVSGFIGVEPFLNGMAKALAAIDARGLTNIRLHHGDAIDLLAWLPEASLAAVYLLYPDPWPKRRHWKRRFVQDRTVAEIARVLRAGGEFRFASDIDDYTAWTLLRLLRSPDFVWTAERADDWRKPWPDFNSTRYETKAKREGRTPCYLTFRRK